MLASLECGWCHGDTERGSTVKLSFPPPFDSVRTPWEKYRIQRGRRVIERAHSHSGRGIRGPIKAACGVRRSTFLRYHAGNILCSPHDSSCAVIM